jgi:hypothetical protein
MSSSTVRTDSSHRRTSIYTCLLSRPRPCLTLSPIELLLPPCTASSLERPRWSLTDWEVVLVWSTNQTSVNIRNNVDGKRGETYRAVRHERPYQLSQ